MTEAVLSNVDHRAADNIRVLSAAMPERAKSGHPGGAMGGADYIHILFSEFLDFDPSDPHWPMRDRFFLDPGHMSPMLYAQLYLLGYFSKEEIMNFRQWGSPTAGHPEISVQHGIENTSGPLGIGHTLGVGAAIAERFLTHRFGDWMAHKTYLYISDGGIQEEISQGAGRTAGFLGLGNVIMFYDANDIQLSTEVGEVMTENTGKKYEAWGWHVQTINGNDHDAIREALQNAISEESKPSLIIGKTTMGKGAITAEGSPYEGQVDTHGKPLSKTGADIDATIKGLGGDPEDPFKIFPEVAEFYQQIKEGKQKAAAAKKTTQASWASENPELADKLSLFLSGKLPASVDFSEIEQAEGPATRDASGTVMSYLADRVENMIVASADLSNSDKTDKYLKKTTSFKYHDFGGKFYQAGVSEFTMATICTGMALHGGVIPACGTFFVFSDFMKPALRLAALMEQPVIFIWTHDAFRVGEDGPTHQPIEQEAQIRLLEQLNNHKGQDSFRVFRPGDANETTWAWRYALENRSTPTGLILSRQGVPDLPGSSYNAMQRLGMGAYILKDTEGTPDIILVANGSEVGTCVEGAKRLEEADGLKVRIVSAPSEGLFRRQSQAYQDAVLPAGVPKFGLTAGLPVTMRGLVGSDGHVFGMTHFGYSGPYKVLDEKFGFTGANVYKEVKAFLG